MYGITLANPVRRTYHPATTALQIVIVILTRKRHGSSLIHLLLVLFKELLVNLSSRGSKSGGGNEFLSRVSQIHVNKQTSTYQSRVANKLAGKPEEWLLEVVV